MCRTIWNLLQNRNDVHPQSNNFDHMVPRVSKIFLVVLDVPDILFSYPP